MACHTELEFSVRAADMVLLRILLLGFLLLLWVSNPVFAVKEYYVKPAYSTEECQSPCYTLQYYASNSNFTDNSRFHFLGGEHDLESVVRWSICLW